ncbi:response regulator transcription factor [Amnibacterium kyonggiense]
MIGGTAAGRLVVGCVEGDPAVAGLLDRSLTAAGHSAVLVRTGADALRRLGGRVDVLLLDVDLPDMDGRDLCRVLRANGPQAPTMFLASTRAVDDVVQGFVSGGLDWLVKPFAVPELIARVEALARRTIAPEATAGLHLDPAGFALRDGPASRMLTPTEFRLAAELLMHAGRLVRRDDLVRAGWAPGARVHGNTLDTYLHRLRRHLEALGSDARIRTVRGVGFVLHLAGDAADPRTAVAAGGEEATSASRA